MAKDTGTPKAYRPLNKLARVLDLFTTIIPTMPLGQIQAFIIVACNPDKSLGEIALLAKMRQSTLSRYLLDWSDKTRTGAPGYGLITRLSDPHELRRNMYALSPLGILLADQILQYLQGV